MRIPFTRITMSSFVLGIVVGSLVMLVALSLTVQLLTRDPLSVPPVTQPGSSDLTIVLPRDTLRYLIDDALANVEVPLVTVHESELLLEPGALVVLHLHGDAALLGAQTVVLRTRIVPLDGRLGVATESAVIGGRINVTGSLTQQLDEQINAILVERLPLDDRLEIVGVDGTADEIIIEAQLRARSREN